MKTYEHLKMFLRRNIDTIFVMMGNECNLNCKYCLQHPMVEHPISHEINPDIYDFIEQVCKENINIPLDIRFWGGEPLVFFPVIKQMVEELEKRELPVKFSTMTNGKLLDEEKLQYCIDHKIHLALSWDGPNVLETRGYDAFKDNKDILLKVPNLCISAVMSAKAYPKEIMAGFKAFDEEYQKVWGHHVGTNIDDIFDTGGVPDEMTDMDYDRVSREIAEMTEHYLMFKATGKPLWESDNYFEDKYMDDLFYNAYYFYSDHDGCNNGKWDGSWCCCGNGYTVLNMGLDGKLYPCHNTSHSIGTIYTGYFNYLKTLIKEDTTFHNREVCKDCEVICYCHGGCKMVSEENRKKTYCKLKKAIYTPFLSALNELGGNLLEKEEVDN